MKLSALFLVLLGTACVAPVSYAQSTGTTAVAVTADTPWVVAADESEPVARALADVQRDWYKVFGHRPVVLREPPTAWRGPIVYLGLKGPWLKELLHEPFAGSERFVLRVQRDSAGRLAILATGADIRGTIYAAYALAEKILGVDPWYYWTDHEPTPKTRIEVSAGLDEQFGPPTFRYRGWFINDEDLLGGFAPDPLRENVYSLDMLDRICETILRLRGNMIVPGTFNFPDERCWELASRRGLALNMHHILVVGLNTYRWPNDVPFSYSKAPEIMERYWRDCIAAFKGREVVWTVGYRGKHDRPFWVDEPELLTPEARGAVITKAIARQVELIRQSDPHAMIIANLWAEGAEMMHAGYLKLPADVVQVWPDDGTGIIRDSGAGRAGQGIYYHTAMLSSRHNQLSEMVPPDRIHGEIGRFAKASATNFLLVNVSDVRPVPLSTDYAMRLAWNAAPALEQTDRQSMEVFLVDWSQRQFGPGLAKEVAAIYARYFDIPYHRSESRSGDNRLHTMLRKLGSTAAAPLAAGKALSTNTLAEAGQALQFVATNRPSVEALAKAAAALAPQVPADRTGFYQSHVLTPIRIHEHSLAMLDNYAAALVAYSKHEKARALQLAEQSLRAADDLFDALHRAEKGKWAAWYMGEGFVGVEASRDQIRVLLSALRGERLPPLRSMPGYPQLYRYQEPFQKNFPRMYLKSNQ